MELVLLNRTFKTKKCKTVGGTHLEFNSSAMETEAGGLELKSTLDSTVRPCFKKKLKLNLVN
jgi:hypothetical protein